MNAEDVASLNRYADMHAPAYTGRASGLSADERRRLVRRGLITMPAPEKVENRGRKRVITPEMIALALRMRADGAPMKQIAVTLRVSVSGLQHYLLGRKTHSPGGAGGSTLPACDASAHRDDSTSPQTTTAGAGMGSGSGTLSR